MAAEDDTTIYLARHGDRYDYAHEDVWAARAEELGFDARDPPLSALGHAQSRELAAKLLELTGGRAAAVLASPYLRVIQTAQPFAHLVGLPIELEEGLAEVSHAPGSIPTAAQRFPYLPEVALGRPFGVPVVATTTDARTCLPSELYPIDYFRRTVRLADFLPRAYAGRTVVCFSHAASVALVALLSARGVREVGKFAPCGIFKLVGRAGGGPWRVELHGGDNSGHVSANSPTTHAWGFAESRWPIEEHWATVLGELARTGA
ncbi:hypothetical protein KFE25_005174 [Diacronema lutheri]|uniref:Phosphoglycerate mutase n=1 Tax=Diacronema lutheri TaxID=2081491 RepID=A0A8J5XCV2_DIALT|nr:hypothetical protein KFE25_005174 [Diacronema lutheri]